MRITYKFNNVHTVLAYNRYKTSKEKYKLSTQYSFKTDWVGAKKKSSILFDNFIIIIYFFYYFLFQMQLGFPYYVIALTIDGKVSTIPEMNRFLKL